jgi:phosphoribosylaminoimidazolecarboxamide formyltransferase/IMP cyclohydrolase
MISDGFFPFRDGIEVGLREGVKSVVQPGGSERDFESIQACNENDAAMVFTGQRSFRH